MPAETVRVLGLTELRRALAVADAEAAVVVRKSLQEGGKLVLGEAKSLGASNDDVGASSVSGYRSRLRGFNTVVVEQSLGRTTGAHPNYGALQMREVLLPALGRKAAVVEARFEAGLDLLAAHFNA